MEGDAKECARKEEKIIVRSIEEEMESSYIDYAMSVIVGRAIPDVRDGLKPVHRRILYAMKEIGVLPNRPYKKSARIVGEVLGKYHPHGDAAVYDALVRMAQDFSMRYPLIDGQGNFGSIDGDSPAAMRYTESRLSKISMEMLEDIENETVKFTNNFDETMKEPEVLPSKLPNLLVNGTSGIAVGMATNMPPHNLCEIVDGIIMLIENPEVSIRDLMEVIKGPDFPTGGVIYGIGGIVDSYTTGRGSIKVRARTKIETSPTGKTSIVVTEIPYTVNKSALLESIAQLVKEKKIDGISDLRDESDRDGMRIVIDLKRDAYPNVVINQLFKHTQMEISFGVISLALVNGEPKVLILKQLLHFYIEHRLEVITNRTKFFLRNAEARCHILEGLIVALNNLDEIIKLIRGSKTVQDAKEGLIKKFNLSEIQAKAILEMRLQKLTAMEIENVMTELEEIKRKIKENREILTSKEKKLEIIKKELLEMKEKYGDERRTEIVYHTEDLDIGDLIPDKEVVIMITRDSYIKRQPIETYRQQKRGGKGLVGLTMKDEDYVVDLFVTRTHNYILLFTDKGKIYWLKAYKIPEVGRHARGKPIINLLPSMEKEERINAFIPVEEFDDKHYIIFITKKGIVKRTILSAFSNPRSTGIRAIYLDEGDSLVDVMLSDGNYNIIIATRNGLAVRFDENDVRPMGRAARGVKGITLEKGDEVIGAALVREDDCLLTVTENGYGKRSPIKDYRKIKRGGKGVITIITNERNGYVVCVCSVRGNEEILLTSAEGMVIRVPLDSIPIQGRNTMGVRIMKLSEGDKLIALDKLIDENDAKND